MNYAEIHSALCDAIKAMPKEIPISRTEGLPIVKEIFDRDISQIGYNQSGIYILHEPDQLVYVGKAICLRKRVKHHLIKRKNVHVVVLLDYSNFLSHFDFFSRNAMLGYFERHWIDDLEPLENHQRPKWTSEYFQNMPDQARDYFNSKLDSSMSEILKLAA